MEKLKESVAAISREQLENDFINLWLDYRKLQQLYQTKMAEISWERYARQQERSGGWM